MTEDLDQRITQLEDRVAIADLVARYTLHAAASEVEALAVLFAEDGAFRSQSGSAQGREALAAFFADSLAPGKTVPIAGQLHIRFEDPGRVRLRCLMASTFFDGKPGGFCGHYDDELVKLDGDWFFASRVFTSYHAV